MKHLDIIIIGAGPAGISAGIQAKRQGLSLAVIEKNQIGGQTLAAHLIENYPGFPNGIKGTELIELFKKQSEAHNVDIIIDTVTTIKHQDDHYEVITKNGTYTSASVIVAIGMVPKKLGIYGEDKIARRIFYYTDPTVVEHKDKEVVIFGSGDAAFDQAISFSKKAEKVTIVMRGNSPKCLPILIKRAEAAGINIMTNIQVDMLVWEGDKVYIKHKTDILKTDVVVGCAGKEINLSIFSSLKIDGSSIRPGAVQEYPGLYFAGDFCRGQNRHIAIAVGDGIACAMEAGHFIKHKRD